jgi:uncharacterized protein YggE
MTLRILEENDGRHLLPSLEPLHPDLLSTSRLTTMPLEIKVQGEAVASRMADLVKIRIELKSKGFYRNEASTTLFKAVEHIVDTLQKLSPTLENQNSMFQATSEGPIASWSVGTQHVQSQTTQDPKTKAFQDMHMITTSLTITICDFQILEHISKAITRAPCVASVSTTWSLTDSSALRLKTEAHELAAKDALTKATAIASGIGFQAVTAEEAAMKSPTQALVSSNSHYSDDNSTRAPPPVPYAHGWPADKFYKYAGGHIEFSDSKWTSRDETGDLDAWTLVLVPKKITLTATVDTKFSATSSTGWVYEEINQHRFLTR